MKYAKVHYTQPSFPLLRTGDPIKENDPIGTVIGTFSVSDPDAGDQHSLNLSGTTLLSLDGPKLTIVGKIDFEASSSISFSVTAKDSGSKSVSRTT